MVNIPAEDRLWTQAKTFSCRKNETSVTNQLSAIESRIVKQV